ncbi:MAG: hypothetical protein ACE5PV_24310 [Candidatus Poribacteria bacterium]
MNLSKTEAEPILDKILSDKEMFRVNLHDYGALAETIKGYYHKMKENGLEATLATMISQGGRLCSSG